MKTYGTITRTKSGAWKVEASPFILGRLRRAFPKVSRRQQGGITISATEETARDLEWFVQRWPLEMVGEAAADIEAKARAHKGKEEAIQSILDGTWSAPRPAFELRYPLRAYQQQSADIVLATGRVLNCDALGLGKQQPVDTPVLTPDGWRPIGSLRPGDEVIGSNGEPTKVLGVYPQGVLPNYRVTFGDGSSTEAGPEHLWTITHKRGGKVWESLVVSTEQLRVGAVLERPGGRRLSLAKIKPSIPWLTAPARFRDCGPLPVSPYLLGTLIANGSTGNGSPRLVVGTKDWPEIKQNIQREDAPISSVRTYGSATHVNLGGMREALRRLGLDVLSASKFIPDEYKRAAPEDRVALLHGLMDADGSCSKTRCRVAYHTISERLANDVQELVECLGGIASVRKYDRTHEGKPVEYQVRVRPPVGIEPFTLRRKAERYKPTQRRNPRRVLKSIEFSRTVESVCIKVAAEDQLYATEHAILTHNTPQAIGTLVRPDALPAVVVCKAHLVTQWVREIGKFAPNLKVTPLKGRTPYALNRGARGRPAREPDVVVLNYHCIAYWAEHLAPWAQSVIFDEAHELRRSDSNKYAGAKHLADACAYRHAYTATPVMNYSDEIIALLDLIAPDALGTRGEFRNEWGMTTDSNRIADPHALGDWLRDQGLMLARTRKDVGRELPAVNRVPLAVDADASKLHAVEGQAGELARIILQAQGFSLQERISAGQQMLNLLRQATGIAKAPAVAEHVRDMLEDGERVVLMGWHRAVYDLWGETLKAYRPAFYTGEESAKAKDESRRRFIEGDTPLLIMSLRSGEGLNGLQDVSRVMVFGELDWSPGVHEQAIGRLHRDGQTDPVFAYYCVADSGSDPIVANVLGLKKADADGIMGVTATADFDAKGGVGQAQIEELARAFLGGAAPDIERGAVAKPSTPPKTPRVIVPGEGPRQLGLLAGVGSR